MEEMCPHGDSMGTGPLPCPALRAPCKPLHGTFSCDGKAKGPKHRHSQRVANPCPQPLCSSLGSYMLGQAKPGNYQRESLP